MIYRKTWTRSFGKSFFLYLRDLLINFIPLPPFIKRCFYKIEPKFIFLVHPRRKEDIFVALPFLRILRNILPKKLRYKVISFLPPFIVSEIRIQDEVDGFVVSSLKLPEFLMADKHAALLEARRCLSFCAKISSKNTFVGLGAWWPIVTKRGWAIKEYCEKLNLKVTNGHCGTLCSIYLMAKKIADISNINFQEVSLLIIGSGKMGTNVARALCGEIGEITLLDNNPARLLRAEQLLTFSPTKTKINSIVSTDNSVLKQALGNHHFCVCTTSNLRRILNYNDLPGNIIVIDDSRPEAFPRIHDLKRNIIILEGGLMKIKGIKIDYDFGFGVDENVFGCLAESYILAKKQETKLMPTLGEVSLSNFRRMLEAFTNSGVEVGDFKISDIIVSKDNITRILKFKSVSYRGQ